jgi:N-acetylglucosaminyl-diphospho-decaprenol L-rhamnosyltransferase
VPALIDQNTHTIIFFRSEALRKYEKVNYWDREFGRLTLKQLAGKSAMVADRAPKESMARAVSAAPMMVVVAIVSTNEAHNIVGCLTSLAASSHGNFRIIICENGGDEGFQRTTQSLAGLDLLRPLVASRAGGAMAASPYPCADLELASGGQRVTVLRAPRNLGYAGGVNACIAAAGPAGWDAVWVLNPDTFPEPAALAALVDRQREGGYGIVGSRLVFAASGLVQTWGGIEWRPWLGRGRLLGWKEPADSVPDISDVERRIGFISGASMFVSRAYIETVGMMDDDFFVYDEDVEWCLRRGKFKLGYAHASVVRHIHGATSGSSLNKAVRSRFNIYLTERNRVLLARKRFGRWWGLVALLALAQTVEHLVRVRSFRQFGIALHGWWAGLRGETGTPGFMRADPIDARSRQKMAG